MILSTRYVAVAILTAALVAHPRALQKSAAADDLEGAMKPVQGFIEAMTNADLDALMKLFDDQATVFMPSAEIPQRLEGRAAIRSAFGALFDQLRKSAAGPPYLSLSPRDLESKVYGNTAIVTFHLGALPSSTAPQPSRFSRRTFVVMRRNGQWRIVHLHASNMAVERPPKPPRSRSPSM
jgi:ketosteroid isomerase-like protein